MLMMTMSMVLETKMMVLNKNNCDDRDDDTADDNDGEDDHGDDNDEEHDVDDGEDED